MASKKGKSFGTILLVIVFLLVKWKYPHLLEDSSSSSGPATSSEKSGDYEVFHNCKLVDARGNDGDSFFVKFPDGKKREVRLYFVDAPESAIKKYRDGNTNIDRIRKQGNYFGGLTPEQTTEIGKDAKELTKSLLENESFDVMTKNELVYEGPRIYCLVKVKKGGESRYLHEILVEEGVSRIHTLPTELPDGTSAKKQVGRLKAMQKKARAAKAGAWNY